MLAAQFCLILVASASKMESIAVAIDDVVPLSA
jgi:hypothetical protein